MIAARAQVQVDPVEARDVSSVIDFLRKGFVPHLASETLRGLFEYRWMTEAEARAWEPKLVFVDALNRPVERHGGERAGQAEVHRAFGAAPHPSPIA